MTSFLAPSSPLTVQDLLRSVPDLGRGTVHGRERWRRFDTPAWSEGWKAAALALGLYETSDFKSMANRWHDEAVRRGEASGPYQGNSRFKRWWSTAADAIASSPDATAPAADPTEPAREAFDVWLVTDVADQQVLGLMVFERWSPVVRDVPELPMDARCKPRFTVPTRVIGEACFWVSAAHRGRGMGSRMAQALVDAYRPVIEADYAQGPFMPFMVAHDRAFHLLERVAPWPLLEQSGYNRGQRRDMLHHALDDADDPRWPAWAVPVTPIAPTRSPSVRRSRRSP